MVIDNEDIIHVAYTHMPSKQLTYAKKVGSLWYKEIVDTVPPPLWEVGVSIALDTANCPCIAYARWYGMSDGDSTQLRFTRKDSTGWRIEAIHTSIVCQENECIRTPSLCIGKDNYPRVCYIAEWDLKYAWFDGISWNITTIDSNVFGSIATFMGMVVDKDGNSHICYDDQEKYLQKYAKGHGFAGVEENNYQLSIINYQLSIWPNPFCSKARIQYGVGSRQWISLKIYDVTGREVRTLVNGKKEPGCHTVAWDGRNKDGKIVRNGVYFCKFKVNEFVCTRKLVRVR
jgi:hypothetical protein